LGETFLSPRRGFEKLGFDGFVVIGREGFAKTAVPAWTAAKAAPRSGGAFENRCELEAADLPFHYI
jgi:hypothetical protein